MAYAVEMVNIVKRYSETGVLANNKVSLSLPKGKILALAGENGAGKSTLMKILYGLELPDEGSIAVNGEGVKIDSPLVANKLGIGMVHQHLMLIDQFSVSENVTLGQEVTKGLRLSHRQRDAEVTALIERHNFPLKAEERVGELTLGQKQQVEILKMLYRNVELLILDEPTALLAEQEVDALFATLRELVVKGVSIILITHKLREIKVISDYLTIMRGGEVVGSYKTAEIDEEEISRLMVGRTLSFKTDKSSYQGEREEVLRLEGITLNAKGAKRPLLNNVSFSAFRGEVLGFAGVGGNGLGELESLLGGFVKPSEGHVFYNGEDITGYSPRQLRHSGLAYVPSNRLTRGSASQASLAHNLIATKVAQFTKGGLLQRRKITAYSNKVLADYAIKGGSDAAVGSLSGGNIQKLILAREIEHLHDYIILSQPTWGLDVESSLSVYNKMLDLKRRGVALLLISSNLDEVLALSDRVAVFYGGEIVALLEGEALKGATKETLGAYMLGLKGGGVSGT